MEKDIENIKNVLDKLTDFSNTVNSQFEIIDEHFDDVHKQTKKIKQFLGKSIESTENLKSEYDTFVDSINSHFYSLRGQVENQKIETDIRFGNELEKLETQIKVLKQRQWFFLIIIIFVLVLQLHQI
jgi:archaellum component FlaC